MIVQASYPPVHDLNIHQKVVNRAAALPPNLALEGHKEAEIIDVEIWRLCRLYNNLDLPRALTLDPVQPPHHVVAHIEDRTILLKGPVPSSPHDASPTHISPISGNSVSVYKYWHLSQWMVTLRTLILFSPVDTTLWFTMPI